MSDQQLQQLDDSRGKIRYLVCESCAGEFAMIGAGRPAKTCPGCRDDYWRAHDRGRSQERRRVRYNTPSYRWESWP